MSTVMSTVNIDVLKMANIGQVTMLAELLDSSSDEENMLPQLPLLDEEDDDNYGIVHVINPVVNVIQRINRVKIMNYIENVVSNYTNHDFIMHFRLSRVVVDELIRRFSTSNTYISLEGPAGYERLSAEKHILSFLWFVGHESASYRDVADRFGITLSALHAVITRVTDFLLSIAPHVIRYPTPEEREISKTYYIREKRFPGIIGALDGSHIRIDKPLADKDSYINRKQYFSLQIQGVVNHEMRFMDVFIGYPGSVHDARVFRESSLFRSLDEMCGEDGYLLGDSAYPCLQKLMVPYRDNGHLTRAQRQFNQRLSSCRVIIENAFGCLKQRFRQLYHFKLRDIVRMVRVIHACCVLHNLGSTNDVEIFEPPMHEERRDHEAEGIYIGEDVNIPEDTELGKTLRNELCRQLAMQ